MEEKRSTILLFFINGVNSLLGWNVVLAGLDYFAQSFSNYNIYSFLEVPVFVGYLIIGLSFHMISNNWKYSSLIVFGNTLLGISLILLFVICQILPNSNTGFTLLMFFALLLGIGSNIAQLTYYAMINYLSYEVVSKYTIGTSFSGLIILIIRIILKVIFEYVHVASYVPNIIYFAIAIVFDIIVTILNLIFCKSSEYKQKIEYYLPKQKLLNESNNQRKSQTMSFISSQITIELALQQRNKCKSEPKPSQKKEQKDKIQSQNYFFTLKQTCMNILPYPLLIFGSFAITFTLFPGPVFTRTFSNISVSWSILIFNFCYNFGDTIGKFLAEIKGFMNHASVIYLFFVKFFFIFTITFLAKNLDKGDISTDNDYFPFINQILFGLSNGICVNGSFILAFKVCPLAYKKYAGILCGLLIQIGLMVGTVLEIGYAYALGIQH